MRNVLVVLVSSCFGLTSGFIVPTGIQEIISDLKDSVNYIHSSAIKKKDTLHTTEELVSVTSISTSTEKAVNSSLDTDLYGNSQTKESAVNKRAYIYIKQNVERPIQSLLYDSNVKIPQLSNNIKKSYLFNMKRDFNRLPQKLSIEYMSQNLRTNTESNKPHDHQCNAMKNEQNEKKKDAYSRQDNFKTQAKTFSNEQRDILELIGTPLLGAEFMSMDHHEYGQKDENLNVINPSQFRNVKPEKLINGIIKGKVHEVVPLDRSGQKNYQSGIRSDNSLSDELIEHKLNEHGSLLICGDCLNKAKKNKLNNRPYLEAMCKCGSDLLPRDAEKSIQ